MQLSRNSDVKYGGTLEYFTMLKEVGYDAVDLNETASPDIWLKPEKEHMAYFERVIENAQKAGLAVGQCHAPWFDKGWYGILEEEMAQREEAILQCVRGAAKLGIPYTVVHPIIYAWQKDDPDREKTMQVNLRHLRRLAETAEKIDVNLALENMPGNRGFLTTPIEMQEMLQAVSGSRMFVCLDTGHAFSVGEKAGGFFAVLKDKIKVLHVHDTFFGKDAHLLPYTGVGDWADFAAAVKTYGYNGTLNSESSMVAKLPSLLRLQAEALECGVLQDLRRRILDSSPQ